MLKTSYPFISAIYCLFVFAYYQNNASAKITTSMTAVIVVVAIASILIQILDKTSPTSSVRMTYLLVRTPVERGVPAVECAAMMLVEGHAAGIGKYTQTMPR